jgi:hypothetical protein
MARTIVVSEQAGRHFTEREFNAFMAGLQRQMEREFQEKIQAIAAGRSYASVGLPTYPGGGQLIQVDTALRFPVMISRALTQLVYQRFVADRIFSRGSAGQVASGAVVFRRSEGIFADQNPEDVGVRSRWPRTGITTGDWYAALVRKRGLEVPVSDEAKRRNDVTEMAKTQRKLANSIVRDVDQLAMAALLGDTSVQTYTASGVWSNTATDKIADIANMRSKINNLDMGYEADTLLVNPAQELQLMLDKNIRDALPREVTGGAFQTGILSGVAVPILGLRQILVTNQLAAGTVIMLSSQVVGSIADEAPAADEGYTGYDPGAGQSPLFVKTYREEQTDETIVRGARFPAIWISEPQAAVVGSGF